MNPEEPQQTTTASAPGSVVEGCEREAADWLPRHILILGTDAAGKNHVARVWTRRMAELGIASSVHEGWLASPATGPKSDADKSWLSHLAESTFLRVFPWIAWGMPFALRWLIWRDARRFRAGGGRRLTVSHRGLRILAFCQGAQGRGIDTLAESTRRVVRRLHERSQALVVVLDVDHEVRHRRIKARLAEGDSDPFDRYMLADPARSERIEACLVSLATGLMDAHLIVNNALDDNALWDHLEKACKAKSPPRHTGFRNGSSA